MNLVTSINKTGKSIFRVMRKHSPEILIGLGISGSIATTVMAVKATPKALQLIEEKKEEMDTDELTKTEIVKAAWKPYIPATIIGVLSISCILGASNVNARRNAALATVYTVAETSLKEYKDKVVETIGTAKEQEIRDSIAKDRIDKNPVGTREIIITGDGTVKCYDMFSDRYFESNIEKLRRAENELNKQILTEGYASLADFYYLINLPARRNDDELGWDTRHALVNLNFSSLLDENERPCLVLNFEIPPIYNYYH